MYQEILIYMDIHTYVHIYVAHKYIQTLQFHSISTNPFKL